MVCEMSWQAFGQKKRITSLLQSPHKDQIEIYQTAAGEIDEQKLIFQTTEFDYQSPPQATYKCL